MTVISIDTMYVRQLGGAYRELQVSCVSLRQRIQVRLLSNSEYRSYFGGIAEEYERLAWRLSEIEAEIEAELREIYGVADRVDGLNYGGVRISTSWIDQPRQTYVCAFPGATSSFVCRFPAWYNDPGSMRWLGGFINRGQIDRRPDPFDWRFDRDNDWRFDRDNDRDWGRGFGRDNDRDFGRGFNRDDNRGFGRDFGRDDNRGFDRGNGPGFGRGNDGPGGGFDRGAGPGFGRGNDVPPGGFDRRGGPGFGRGGPIL